MLLTPTNFKQRKPQFAKIDDEIITRYLDDATLFVDESWPQKLIAPATAAITSHMMTLDGLGDDAASESYRNGSSEFISMTSGSLSLTRRPYINDKNTTGWLSQTACGRAFLHLLAIAKTGPRIIRQTRGAAS